MESAPAYIQVATVWRFPSMFAPRLVIVGIIFAILLLVRLRNASATDATPPTQPEKGPGGKEYAHKAAKQSCYGEGDTQYWIIEPDQPAPDKAPVVIFCHGWSAMD